MLETKNLIKHFDGVYAINDLSVSVDPGITAIIGPNGSGKTTLVNVLSGVLAQDGGHVAFTGNLTRTFQDVRLWNQMSVLDNVLVVLTERNVFSAIFEFHSKEHLDKAEQTLKMVGLWEKRGQLAGNLSYGQRKLLEVGRALATNADVYLFDEPFAGLFPEMVKTIVGIMEDLRSQGKTLILIEHAMDLIRKLSDQVIVMDSGKLLAQGQAEEVLRRRDVIEAYLGD